MTTRRRADQVLVERGLFESRSRAQAAIEAGLVTADGAPVTKASAMIEPDALIEAGAPHPWVSRGGVKLAFALRHFGVPVQDRLCLDVGSSTGGFTDVLLANGARQVIAVDSGREQMHARLRDDPRVIVMEETDIRRVAPFDAVPDLTVIDVSFISLVAVLPAVSALLAPKADMIALVKPQFEVGRVHVGKGGIVKDAGAVDGALARVLASLTGHGFFVRGPLDSPITGGAGNREYLVHAWREG